MPIFECKRCNELTYSASTDADQACSRCGDRAHRVLDGSFESVRDTPRDLSHGDHATHVYDDPELVAPFCADFLTAGIDRGECVMAALPDDLRAAVERLLAPDVGVLIDWWDAHSIYCDFDADRVAGLYDALISGEARTVRILGVWDRQCAEGVDPADFDRYEVKAHDIITRYGATAVCLYDLRGLDEGFVAASERRHALCVTDGVARRNETFEFQPV